MTFPKIAEGLPIADTMATLPLWHDTFPGASIANDRYAYSTALLVPAQASGFVSLNSTGSVSDLQNTVFQTWRTFPVSGMTPILADMWLQTQGDIDTASAGSGRAEWGFGTVPVLAQGINDGIFFRSTMQNGRATLLGVISYAGNEATVVLRDGVKFPDTSVFHRYRIEIRGQFANFYIDEDPANSMVIPVAFGAGTGACAMQLTAWVITGTTTPSARNINIGGWSVYGRAQAANKPWGHAMAGGGGHSTTVQPGSASGFTAEYANGAAPATITPAATGATAYNKLGGQYAINSVAAAETDLVVFAYSNPGSTSIRSGKSLYVTGIRIGEMYVTGAAVGAATVFQWGCGNNLSASLAATDGASTFACRRMPLGSIAVANAAAIGSLVAGLPYIDLSGAPIHVPAGTRFLVFFKQPFGAATGSLVWRGTVTVNGYFE